MKRKLFLLLLIVSVCLGFLTGCYDVKGIEDLAYAIAIGIDSSETNVIKLSLQFFVPTSEGSGDSSSSQSSSSTVISVDCDSIDSGINLINSYVGKEVNLAHCKAIVISETVAANGISEYLYTLINNIQVRPDCNMIVSRCNAETFLQNSKPTLETLPARYYETAIESIESTGYSESMPISRFYDDYKDKFCESSAVLGGLNTASSEYDPSDTPYIDLAGNYKADEMPIEPKNNVANLGMAVFIEDKLVGELDGLDTLCHLMITNEFEKCVITISSPFKENKLISLFVTKQNDSKNKVQLVNGSPFIKSDVYLKASILSADINSDYSNEGNLDLIEKYLAHYLENQLTTFLYKTSANLKSDIIGFGRLLRTEYLRESDLGKLDWSDLYPNSTFSCNVKCNVTSRIYYF